MRLWVNKARTVLVSEMDDGNLTVALRNEEGDIWGPPILCVEEHGVWHMDPPSLQVPDAWSAGICGFEG
jgi:hypothetical protein